MGKVLFVGCSYTSGAGFDLKKSEPGLWVNLLHQKNSHLQSLELVNVARDGRSNSGIFMDAVWNLTRDHYKYAVVAWTSMPRFEIEVGLETYDTSQILIPNCPTRTHKLNDVTYTKDYLDKIRDRLTTLIHLHGEIRNLVYYVDSLVQLADQLGTKIFFVNAICPWDAHYFNRMADIMPNQTTEFTQTTIINLHNRSDEEFFLLYHKIHDEYDAAGGIHQERWLNLYGSLGQARIDVNADQSHPGLESNQLYFQFLDQALQQMI